MRSRLAIALVLVLATCCVAVAVAASGGGANAVGPKSKIQPNGRKLAPVGRLTKLGNHPGGGALTTNGRFLWALDAGRGRNDVRIVDVLPALSCPSGSRGATCRAAARKRAGRVI